MIDLLIGAALVAAAETPTETASSAIARGMAAEEAGDGPAMLAAARSLEALGAKPRDGEADLAEHWRGLALARGIADKTPPVRGRALGPGYSRGTLPAGAALSTEQVFLAGQKAEIALVPQVGRNLAIRISARDKVICERARAAPRVTCSWLPVFTNRVAIRVANQSREPARFYLVSN